MCGKSLVRLQLQIWSLPWQLNHDDAVFLSLSFFLIFDADDFKFSPVIVEELKKDKVTITDSCLIFVKIF